MDDFQRLKDTVNPNYIFYRALVEDNKDPELLNRCKIRIVSIHTEDKKKLPTEALPWAELAFPTTRGDQSIPLPGDWVWCFFDRDDENRPIIFARIPFLNQGKPDLSKGFSDPSGVYPKEQDYNQLSTHRCSRVQELDKTPHKIINDSLTECDESGAACGTSVSFYFKEKPSKNDASKYPDVAVQETSAGHVFEIDDTAGNNRIRVFHSSHTYYEIENTGTLTLKTVKNFERFVEADDYENIKGNKLKRVVGNEKTGIDGNRETLVKGNVEQAIVGNQTEGISGNVTRKVCGKEDVNISGGFNMNANPKAKIHASAVFIDSYVYLG
jgi:ribosomal protein L31